MYFNIVHLVVFHLAADSSVPIMREMTVLTVFLMGNIASVFIRFGSRQTFLNGLITKTEVPLYLQIIVYTLKNIFNKQEIYQFLDLLYSSIVRVSA